MNKINELYTQLATQMPQSDRPVEDNFELPELDEVQQKELGDYIQQAYSMYEGLPPAQKFVAEVAPGTGEAISAVEAKKMFEETKDAVEEGKFGEAALKGGLTILAGLGTIPIAGKGIQLAKAAAKRLPELLSSKNLNKILKENKKPVTDFNKEKLTDEIEESKEYLDLNLVPKGQEPKNVIKGYKLFREKDGDLFPLFVDTKNPIPKNQWMKADKGYYFLDTKDIKRQPALTGDYQPIKTQADVDVLLSKGVTPTTTKKALEKSPFGTALAVKYRPGWHGDTFPSAKHLAQGGTGKGKDRVWAEVEFSNDKDYTDIVRERGTNPETGKFSAKNADLDYVPEGGSYRYKTNPNMEGSWLIGGEMKVNRVLSKDEVKAINQSGGIKNLPRKKELLNKDVEITEINKFNPTDKPRINPTQTEKGFINPKQLKNVPGESGEVRGAHRDIQGKDWEIFKKDIKEKGVQNPIHLNVDPGVGVRVSEGNHRLDAALEVGLDKIPFTRSSFGKAEQEFLNPDGTIKNVKRGTK